MATIQLTDQQQAFAMMLVFIFPALIVWSSLGMPTDRISLALLFSGIFSGVLAYIKELLGWKPSVTQIEATNAAENAKERAILKEALALIEESKAKKAISTAKT